MMSLFSLASGKRIKLQALSVNVGFSVSDGSILLSYVHDFISKADLSAFSSLHSFSIPALSSLVGEDKNELLLWPVRALK